MLCESSVTSCLHTPLLTNNAKDVLLICFTAILSKKTKLLLKYTEAYSSAVLLLFSDWTRSHLVPKYN